MTIGQAAPGDNGARTSTDALSVLVLSAAGLLSDHRLHGEALIAHDLLDGLVGRGHRVVALTSAVDYLAPPKYEVVLVGGGRLESLRPMARARNVRAAVRRLGAVNFDVVQWLFPEDRDEMAFAADTGLPLVLGPLSGGWPTPRFRIRAAGDAMRLALRPGLTVKRRAVFAGAEVLVSNPAVSATLPPTTREPVVVPYPIDSRMWTQTELPQRPVVLYVGRLAPEKNVAVLLDAFARLPLHLGARLVLAGDGPLADRVRARAASADVAGRVDVLGMVEPARVPRLLAGCSLLCLPSTGEPFGRAILEAMAAGRAVVAGRGRGPDFLVRGGGGAVVDGNDVGELARALTHLLSNQDLLRGAGAFNRRRAMEEFDREYVLDLMEAAYHRAISWSRR